MQNLLLVFSCLSIMLRHPQLRASEAATWVHILLIPAVQSQCCSNNRPLLMTPHWGAADAEIKVPSGENTELKHSPFQAWSRSVYSHTCYAYCQGVLPCLFLPFQSIHLHFFQNLSQFFSCVGLQSKIGHSAGCRFPCSVPAAYKWAKKA